jgi:hypothetical protein
MKPYALGREEGELDRKPRHSPRVPLSRPSSSRHSPPGTAAKPWRWSTSTIAEHRSTASAVRMNAWLEAGRSATQAAGRRFSPAQGFNLVDGPEAIGHHVTAGDRDVTFD